MSREDDALIFLGKNRDKTVVHLCDTIPGRYTTHALWLYYKYHTTPEEFEANFENLMLFDTFEEAAEHRDSLQPEEPPEEFDEDKLNHHMWTFDKTMKEFREFYDNLSDDSEACPHSAKIINNFSFEIRRYYCFEVYEFFIMEEYEKHCFRTMVFRYMMHKTYKMRRDFEDCLRLFFGIPDSKKVWKKLNKMKKKGRGVLPMDEDDLD